MKKDVALALLGLDDSELSSDRINEAYRASIQMNHPDRYASNEKLRRHAEEQCKLINEARDVLLSGNWSDDRKEWHDDQKAQREPPKQQEDANNAEASHTDENERSDGAVRTKAQPTAKPARKPNVRKEDRNRILGAIAIIAAIVAWLIPAEIPVPARTLNDMNDKGDYASITYINSSDKTSTFKVSGDPSDFFITATISLPSEVKPDTKGYVGTLSGDLRLDGSYEYKYEFLFPRNGNLLQSLLTRFGIWNFNLPTEGHVEGITSMVGSDRYYHNDEDGFAAAFPSDPEKTDMTGEEQQDMPWTQYFGQGGNGYTQVDVMNLSQYSGYVASADAEQKKELLTHSLNQFMQMYYEILKPKNAGFQCEYSEVGNYPCVKAIAPFTYQLDSEAEGREVFCYGLSVMTDSKVYVLTGSRETYEDAKQALESFGLI